MSGRKETNKQKKLDQERSTGKNGFKKSKPWISRIGFIKIVKQTSVYTDHIITGAKRKIVFLVITT
jgi:hypothetical protein